MNIERISERPASYKYEVQNRLIQYLAAKEQDEMDNDFVFNNWINNGRAEALDQLLQDPDFSDSIDCFMASDTEEMKDGCFADIISRLDGASQKEAA